MATQGGSEVCRGSKQRIPRQTKPILEKVLTEVGSSEHNNYQKPHSTDGGATEGQRDAMTHPLSHIVQMISP